ncbi:gastrin-releasing peptide receptor-like [Anneissia japonica]|uniref:gastrin-releasing peptide receptor-like n=1 Tax=Anneissia japonica TaxID=1529436 RepID=UPI00142572DA|nr:gastrin-releasing peptide receptor-like [Anneissia japonica]
MDYTSEPVQDLVNDSTVESVFGPVVIFVPCVFGAIGVIANLSMIFAVLCNIQLRNITNIMIVNAAVGDIMAILIMLPTNAYVLLHSVWPFGDFLCKLSNMVNMYSLTTSAYSFCALSTDRYMAVARPLTYRTHRNRRITFCIVAIDLIGLISVIPTYFLAYERSNVCFYLDHGTLVAKIHEIVLFIFVYIIPLLIISVNYIRIASVLMRSIRHQLFEGDSNAAVKQHATRVRLTKTVLLIIVLYGLCMLPYYLANIVIQFLKITALEGFFKTMYFPSSICYVLATLVNPVMMFTLSKTYRRHFMRCPCFKRTERPVTGSNMMTAITRRTAVIDH